MSEDAPRNSPRAGCWFFGLPLIAIPALVGGYAVLVYQGYMGKPATGSRVVLDVETCDAGIPVIQGRIEDMGLGDPEYSERQGGIRATVTLPDNDFADDIPVSLGKQGRFEIWSKGEVILTNERVESATLRLDFTGEPSIAIQLDPSGAATLEQAMRADPEGMVQLTVDGDDMGDRVNTPTETRGRITLPITGPDRPAQVARAAEFGLVMGRPLPCPATVQVSPVTEENP